MKIARSKLISKIIYKKLSAEVDRLRAIARQGFDIHALSPFDEVNHSLKELLTDELQENERLFRIVHSTEEIVLPEDPEMAEGFLPNILISTETIACGMGFITYTLPHPDELLQSVPRAIEEILEHFGISLYVDIFDAQKLKIIKQITKSMGIKKLVDCVVQIAYLEGFQGDQKGAQKYLEHVLSQEENTDTAYEVPLESCAKKFLSHVVMHGENAHTFLKSCLSYYVVSDQGYTMSRASQILSISRTTLQEHLRLASELGVSHFFDGKLNPV